MNQAPTIAREWLNKEGGQRWRLLSDGTWSGYATSSSNPNSWDQPIERNWDISDFPRCGFVEVLPGTDQPLVPAGD